MSDLKKERFLNMENPVTALYFFLQGQLEVGNGSGLEEAGRLTGDAETLEVGRSRVENGLRLMDQATKLARQLRQSRS